MKFHSVVMMGILITGSLGVFAFDNVFAQELEITRANLTQFATQKTSYTFNETIVISGHIEDHWLNESTKLYLNLPSGNIIFEFDLPVDNNGDFTYQITAGGEEWTDEGTYTLRIIHVNDSLIDKTTSFKYKNLIGNEHKIETISEQLDSQTQSKIKSLDSKISREQSQYDEYYKQYQYYEERLSQEEDPKFSRMISKLDSLNQKINSLIDERNALAVIADLETVSNPIKQVEKNPQKALFCFLFWCW